MSEKSDLNSEATATSHSYAPYNPDAACPRCGRTPVGTRSCDITMPSPGFWGPFHSPMWVDVVGGHLHRQCGRCDYEWIEMALDARMMTQDEIETRGVKWKEDADRYNEARWPRASVEGESKKRWPWK